jgi:hypothetical protein
MFFLSGLAAAAAAASQEAPWMSETDLRSTFAGQTIDGHYPNGSTFTETYDGTGRIDYRDTMRSSGGRWSIVEGTFCTIYDDDPTGGCFRVIKSGTNCFEFYFVARTEDEASRPRSPDWTARGWLADRNSTCTEGSNV